MSNIFHRTLVTVNQNSQSYVQARTGNKLFPLQQPVNESLRSLDTLNVLSQIENVPSGGLRPALSLGRVRQLLQAAGVGGEVMGSSNKVLEERGGCVPSGLPVSSCAVDMKLAGNSILCSASGRKMCWASPVLVMWVWKAACQTAMHTYCCLCAPTTHTGS